MLVNSFFFSFGVNGGQAQYLCERVPVYTVKRMKMVGGATIGVTEHTSVNLAHIF